MGDMEKANQEIRIQKVRSFPFLFQPDLHNGVLLICELSCSINPENFLMKTKLFW